MTRTVKPITSLTNDRVKAIRALDMRKERKETGLFVAEGASLIMTARAAGFSPQTLVYRAGALETDRQKRLVNAVLDGGAEVLEVSSAVLEKLAAKENPQSMLAVFRQRWVDLPDEKELPQKSVWLVLEDVRDPGNLGTIIRTADAVGASGVILAGQCTDPYSREAVRATMGSIFNVPLVAASREAFLTWVPRWPGDVVATTLASREDFRKANYRMPVLLMMGSEGPGLSEALAAIATRNVKIPMAGKLDSLNLAVATALMLYQLRGADLKL
jgi:RNA methyltransferase, TrmH family